MVWSAWSLLRAKLTLTGGGEAGSWPAHGLGMAVLLGGCLRSSVLVRCLSAKGQPLPDAHTPACVPHAHCEHLQAAWSLCRMKG